MQLQSVGVINMQILMLVTFGMENKFYEMLVKEGIQCTACQILQFISILFSFCQHLQ